MNNIRGGIYAFQNSVKKEVYVGKSVNFEKRKYQHENGSHSEELYKFVKCSDTKFKEIYEFYDLTDKDDNDLFILEDYICKKYKDIGYHVLNTAPIYIDTTKKLSDKFCKEISSQKFVAIDDRDIEEIRRTMCELRSYIVNNIISYSGIVRKTDIENIIDIICKSKTDYLYLWWEENIAYSSSLRNRKFEEIFWDIGIGVISKYDSIKESWSFVLAGFEQRIDRYRNDYAFIANILHSERIKQNYSNIVYDVKSVNLDWYVENKKLFSSVEVLYEVL